MAELEKFRLSQLSWDGDKDEDGFYIFLENMGSLVRSTRFGDYLEDMLDSKLKRVKAPSSVPSFLLDDPDFSTVPAAPAPPAQQEEAQVEGEGAVEQEDDTEAQSAATGGSRPQSSTFSLGTHRIAYSELPEEARTLDRMLYNVLRMSIKGSKQSVLACVTFPSYVQAVCVLDKHMAISRLRRIMAASTNTVMYAGFQGSVLDSGSSKHLHTKVQVTHADDVASLTGFDSSSQAVTWTEGNGYLPLAIKDTRSGETVSVDLYDADKLNTVALDLLSMGKMIRAKWEFHFESEDKMYAIPPQNQAEFDLKLGSDDIIRFPHSLRTGKAAAPLPRSAAVLHAKRVPESVK